MFDAADPYVEFMRSKSSMLVHVKPYVGNSGDTLIRIGTELMLEELGIQTTLDVRKADLILWPGGNPSMWPGNGWAETLTTFADKSFVVGPGTFQFFEGYEWGNLLQQTRLRVEGVFARDTRSFRNLQKEFSTARFHIGLGHDPALHLRNSTWAIENQAAATEEYALASFRRDLEASIAHSALAAYLPKVFRKRVQRKAQARSWENRLAQVEKFRTKSVPLRVRDVSTFDFESFVERVRGAKEVHTDRLHCMLLAVLLEKPTFAYPTAYNKLEAVFEHSLKGWANVQFPLKAP